jgi:hypothetical protein
MLLTLVSLATWAGAAICALVFFYSMGYAAAGGAALLMGGPMNFIWNLFWDRDTVFRKGIPMGFYGEREVYPMLDIHGWLSS